jgi:hypothetical protein
VTDFQALQIQPGGLDTVLTPEQERFNALVRDVALWRATLADWKDRIARYEQAVAPIHRQVHAAFRQWVFALDTASLQPGLARAERGQLSELLREAATALLAAEDEDAEIAAVLGRHEAGSAGDDRDVEEAESSESPISNEEDSLADLADAWQRQAEAAAADREKRAASRRAASATKRRSQEAQQVSQSLRDVFRRVASALHPDRATDPQQRERKTVLMQQANQAYADGNLLALLELQLQAEQVDPAHLAALDARRLQHYITVLEGQLEDLQAETRRLEGGFRASAGLPPGSGLAPRKADRLITSEAQRLRGELQILARQVKLLLDVEATKMWLRDLRRS